MKKATLMLTLTACTATAPGVPPPEHLDAQRGLEHERMIGPEYRPSDLLMRNVYIRDVRSLLAMGVAVSSPRGDDVDAKETIERAQKELASALGGWFEADLRPYITVHADLWSAEERAKYLAMHITDAKEPPVLTYRLGFVRPPWSVQATGVPGKYHALVVFQLLPEERALGPGGHQASWPVGQVEPLLAEAAPRLQLSAMRDGSGAREAVGYLFYRSSEHVLVRARTCERLDARFGTIAPPENYFFGIRINIQ